MNNASKRFQTLIFKTCLCQRASGWASGWTTVVDNDNMFCVWIGDIAAVRQDALPQLQLKVAHQIAEFVREIDVDKNTISDQDLVVEISVWFAICEAMR